MEEAQLAMAVFLVAAAAPVGAPVLRGEEGIVVVVVVVVIVMVIW